MSLSAPSAQDALHTGPKFTPLGEDGSLLSAQLFLRPPKPEVERPFEAEAINCPLSAVLGDFRVWNETGRLRNVIIGQPHPGINYDPEKAPPIDRATRLTQELGEWVPAEKAVAEFLRFRHTLESHGVTVASPAPIHGAYNQIYTRDIALVIGDTFVPTRMKPMEQGDRSIEMAALSKFIAASRGQSIAVCNDPRATFEGGDILLHDGKLFVGLSERTNEFGLEWLQRTFRHFTVVPMELVQPTKHQEALHNDCAFAPIGDLTRKTALVAPESYKRFDLIEPYLHRWDIIEVTKAEQALLGTNVFSIDPSTVIVRDRCERLVKELSDRGFNPIPLPFDAAASLGGLFRCCTMPVYRD